MKIARLVRASMLSVALSVMLLGTISLTYGQEQRDEAKPQEPDPRPDTARPEQPAARPGDAKPAEQNEDKPAREEEKPKQDDKAAHPSGQNDQQMGRTQGSADQHKGRIPDDKFRANFGRQHTFKVQHVTMIAGRPGFEYGGYSFTLVNTWPAGWAYTDDCYVDYIDGEYYLIDLAHPGVRLALVVVM